jgi:hypothetical protein
MENHHFEENDTLVGGFNLSEKYESHLMSLGMMKFPIYGKIKAMFQTNQYTSSTLPALDI